MAGTALVTGGSGYIAGFLIRQLIDMLQPGPVSVDDRRCTLPDKQAVYTEIEALINQELGEPFRRDAMKKPVEVAGISKADMRPQVVA